jgi:ribosomal protein S18 acetylase RimI-like enzyme
MPHKNNDFYVICSIFEVSTMTIRYQPIQSSDYDIFHQLLNEYFRSGEDADTPQEEVDAFIRALFDMLLSGKISGCLVDADGCAAGFVLWMKVTAKSEFSQIPGFGTILEIGLRKTHRNSGFGKAMVAHAERQMIAGGVDGLYVSAYGPAQGFWKKCGYRDNGTAAANGLPIFIKDISNFQDVPSPPVI